jgi:hypothetical protein
VPAAMAAALAAVLAANAQAAGAST